MSLYNDNRQQKIQSSAHTDWAGIVWFHSLKLEGDPT